MTTQHCNFFGNKSDWKPSVVRDSPPKDEVQGLWDHALSLRRSFRRYGFFLARHACLERPRIEPERWEEPEEQVRDPLPPFPPLPPLPPLPPPPESSGYEPQQKWPSVQTLEMSMFNWIGKLHELYQKKLERPVQKDEIRFTTKEKLGPSKHTMFQCTVDAKEFQAGPFVGETCRAKKAAQHSAARAALENEFPHFLDDVNCEEPPDQWKR